MIIGLTERNNINLDNKDNIWYEEIFLIFQLNIYFKTAKTNKRYFIKKNIF